MRLYAPALVLLFWAAVIAVWGVSREMAAVAVWTLAVAMIVHLPEHARFRRRR